MAKHTFEAPTKEFIVPQLVPDTEPVEAQDTHETTNPGVLGFTIPKVETSSADPKKAEGRKDPYYSGGYVGMTRREAIDFDMERNRQAEERREAQRAQLQLARQALAQVPRPVHQPLRPGQTFHPQ